jgi:ABC-type amino acid transport substrate-binding protein/serine phosphatase RsbU (regulator of sigma subunit)
MIRYIIQKDFDLRIIALVVFFLFCTVLSAEQAKNSLQLTQKEIEWIEKKRHVTVGAGMEWAPFNFVNEKGRYDGIAHDYLELISKLTGLDFTYKIHETWNENLNAFKEGKVDMLPAVYYTKERESYGRFTDSYFKFREFIYFKEDNSLIHSLSDLAGKTIAIPKGYATIERIRHFDPSIKILETDSVIEGIKAVLSSKADALIEGQSVIEYALDRNMISGIKGIPQTHFKPSPIFFYISKDNNMLYTIMQKALHAISKEQKQQIRYKWLRRHRTKNTKLIRFTMEEKEWMKEHNTIRFTGDPDWLPFEAFNSDGEYIGIVADLLDIVEKRTGLNIQKIPTKSWSESLELFTSNQVDMLTETTDSELRKNYIFTNSYLSNPIIIIMDRDNNYVEKLDNIRDKKIVLIKDYGYTSKIEKRYPYINFFKVENIQDGLDAISEGKYDALLCTMALGGYMITKMQLNDIKIVGKTEFTTELGFAIHKDTPQLTSILNKVFKSIDQKTMQEILFKWVTFKYVEKVDYTLIYQMAFVAFLIISGTLFWNHRLKVEITRRKTLQKKVDDINRSMTDSITFASMIQKTIIPENSVFDTFFDDHFVIWEPRDIVGGDIYFLNILRSGDEAMLMVIDCTGHGVPGAFVTMLVKAIERQMVGHIISSNEIVSPANLLAVFNRSIKHLLKQKNKNSTSNVGFDAGILYINKGENKVLYAGANISLFYVKEGRLYTIKGDRHSIGYKTSNSEYSFNDHEILLDETTRFYITSDGYIDQNGGEKEFPMGKTKFKKIITENYLLPMSEQKELFVKKLDNYQGELQRNDDVLVVGFTVEAERKKG